MREYDLSRLRILAVDDNRHFITILRTMLRAFGVKEIYESTDAVEALEILRQTEIDLALLDLKLGDIDGLEWTRLVRSAPDSQNPRMPIIMVSAFSERSSVEAAIDSGVDEFLVKPLSPNLLFKRIVSVIEHPRPYVREGAYFGPVRDRTLGGADTDKNDSADPVDPFDSLFPGLAEDSGDNTDVVIEQTPAVEDGHAQRIEDLSSSVRDVNKAVNDIVGAIERQNETIEGISRAILQNEG